MVLEVDIFDGRLGPGTGCFDLILSCSGLALREEGLWTSKHGWERLDLGKIAYI
jgi:hypothetical protein